jgi:hypothetical protein
MRTQIIEETLNKLEKCKSLEDKKEVKKEFYKLNFKFCILDTMWQEIMRRFNNV